ncbi:subclass B1 metallo-beta-lactamase [Thalassotalea atypica]|uniref:subclass B1 metallo-beta-lactamase n=1 Tax=Thalassotalea atypica TaxID=2054316 RepID=UPI00257432DF|nr:subclass B1 metallo-beta-lactamase [Thalassotalea atypica]
MKFIVLFLSVLSWLSMAASEASNLKMVQLTDNVYQHISYKEVAPWGLVGASGLVVIDGENAHIIDTPWTVAETKQLLQWIKSKNLTVKSSVVTHFHEDASGGMSLLNELNIKTYATELTNTLLSENEKEPSNHVITKNTFELVPDSIEVFYPGAGHSQDNIVVWLPQSNMLFGGCFIKSLGSKSLGYTGDASIPDWPKSISNVINKYPNIKTVVPGHGKVGNKALLHHTAQMTLKKI